ncbi:8-oxo-dGTP diphosphatase MutT [Synechococcus sp. RSCCF101]|nr:8-oxo-dGTP diphosphatase MutT [Synechococcus sp. RSCCF101]
MVTRAGRWPEPGEQLSVQACWIAEVMLQQTQLRVMRPYWRRWMEAFPDRATLAAAPPDQVLLVWQGLGYYSRARRLQQAAQQLEERAAVTGAPWPQDLADWLALPGLGRTTAAGILSSAFDAPEAILDGNVKRVLARLLACPTPPARAGALFWSWSDTLLDPARPRDFNQALMDLGATVCTPRAPACERCPWRPWCAAYAAGTVDRYPVKADRRPVPHHVVGVGVVFNERREVLIDQRLDEGLLGGLWEFPGGKQEPGEAIEATIVRELREELAIEVDVAEPLIELDHAYSHKRLRFLVHLCRWRSGVPRPLASQQVRWVAVSELERYPFPAANSRIIAALRDWLAAAEPGWFRVAPAGSSPVLPLEP